MALRDTKSNIGFTNTDFRVPFLFFGNETLATGVASETKILRSLIDEGWIPDAIILAQRTPAKKPHTVETVANEHTIPVQYIATKNELLGLVERYNPTFAVLAAFGMIITQEVLDMIPDGIVNIHPSLLPKYRGTSPIESTLLNGDEQTGVSLMKLDAGMDTGELYEQRTLDVDTSELTKQELHDQLAELGAQILIDHVDAVAAGSAKTTPQLEDTASITQRIQKSDGKINWNLPAEVIERQIRAYAGWPKSTASIRSHSVIIHEILITEHKSDTPGDIEIGDNALFVSTATDQIEISSLQPVGKNTMNALSFINGYLSD